MNQTNRSGGLASVLLTVCFATLLITTAACSRSLPSTVETEASLATTEYLDQRYGMNSTPELLRLLKRVGTRLAGAVHGAALDRESFQALEGDLLDYQWQVYVVKDRQPNAFSVGAGIIFITEGLLRRLVSEAELAAVLSHEMAHQLLGHTREAISAQSGVTRDEPALAYSLEREIQADSLSLKLLKVARYDLRSATSALALGYRESAENVSSVPPDWMAERMANMERKIERIGQFLPATGSTREFNKVRRQLFG